MTPRLTVSMLLCCALVLSGCGIGAEDQARAIDSIPEEWETTLTTVAPESQEEAPDFFLHVYYVDTDNRLRSFDRPKDSQPTLQEAVEAVFGQPTDSEIEDVPGIRNSLPLQTSPFPETDGPDGNGVLTIRLEKSELSDTLSETPDRIRRVYSQIVCTMVAMEWLNVSSVRIEDASGVIRVTVDASPLERPVGAADVDDCKTAEQQDAEAAEAQDEEGVETTEGG